MSLMPVLLWVGYGVLLLYLTYRSRTRSVLLPGRVGALVQAFAYVATYISAVALIGFAGLGHSLGMQIQFVTMGCVWFGCWMVYKYVAWPTRLLQRALGAQTPIELMAKGFGSRSLGKFYGLLSGILIIIYCSAVFKGGALILASAAPVTPEQALALMVGVVAVSVLWGGLRAVLYTEALQGFVMAVGIVLLVIGALRYVGGFGSAMQAMAALPPTPQADNGFLSMSSGANGMNIVFLMLVTSVGMWAQPQIIQRHFALKSRDEARRIIPMVMLIIAVLLGGALFVGGISRLILGPDVISADAVMPAVVRLVLPAAGVQIFALAIVSASLSTASALLHVSCATMGQDVFGKQLTGWKWRIAVLCGALSSGLFALYNSSIIALICATSWTFMAAAMWVPYLALVTLGPGIDARTGWMATLLGTAGAALWHFLGYAPSSVQYSGISAPGLWGHVHPMLLGMMCSAAGLAAGLLLRRMQKESGRALEAAEGKVIRKCNLDCA